MSWCSCKRLRGDGFAGGVHERCGRPTQGGPAGVTPINIAAALRDDGSTGMGTPGDGIGEPGDPSSTLSVSGATPAVFVKVHNAQTEDDYESWAPAAVSRTLNTFDTGDARATVTVITEEQSVPDSKKSKVSIPEPPLAECGCCPADPKPDSSRYKAAGNAVTVNVAQWIGERMRVVLFDE